MSHLKPFEVVSFIRENGFKKTVDIIDDYASNSDLYYRSIGNNQYLVFCHYYLSGKVDLQGFDAYLSSYSSEEKIGKEKSLEVIKIKLGFQFPEDWSLLSEYVK